MTHIMAVAAFGGVRGWAKATGILGVTACLALWHAPVAARNDGLKTYGDIGQYAIPVIAGVISLAREDVDGTLQLSAGALVTRGLVEVLKQTIDSDRPNDSGGKSFPSGHTSAAFTGASYLHYRYGWEWGVPAYLAASVVGYSRIDAEKHHVIDVIGGAAIANVVAYVLTDTLNPNIVVIPVFDRGKKNFGIIASIKF